MFTNPDTNERDLLQQRAFEVIVGMFVMTFHDKAARNEGRHSVGTQTPRNRAGYNNLKKKLKKIDRNEESETVDHVHDGCGWEWQNKSD
jgi:hypothetical protein